MTMAELTIQELSAMSECAVCLSSATSPKVLPCQHIFCLACLQGVYDQTTKDNPTTVGQLTCPLCSAVSPILAGDLTQLPSDFRTNQATTGVENVHKATSAWNCVVCSKNKLDADTRVLCFDCGKLFCTECHTTHMANKRFEGHVYTSVSTGLDELYCAEHKDFFCNFCIDCTIGICQMCLLISHADHKFEAYAKSDGTPNQTVVETTRVKMKLNQLLDQHRSICQREVIHTLTIKDSIRKHKLDLIKKLDDGEHELFTKLDQELKQFQGLVEKTASNLEGALPKLERLERESQIIARPHPAAPNIKLTVSDLPRREAVKDITSTPYHLHSPSKYKFTKAEGSLGSLHQISPISETLYTLGGSGATGRETASVVQSYQAKTHEELSIQKGDIIEIWMKSNDGWWVGDIRSPGQTSKTGWFPAHCVTATSFIQQLRKDPTKKFTTPESSQSGTTATSAALPILQRGDLQPDGSSLTVTRPQPGEEFQRLFDTVLIEVIKCSKITDFEKFLEIGPEFGSDKLQDIDMYLDRNMAIVRFKDHKDAQNLVERGNLSAYDLKLRVSPVDTSVEDSKRYQGPLAIAVTNIKPDTKEEMIKLFFRNRAKSGGGEITALYWNPQTEKAVISFQAAQTVADVIEKHTLKILRIAESDLEITRMIPLPPTKLILGPKDPSRAFIIEAPEVTPDELKRYIGSVHLVDQKQNQQPELMNVLYSFEGRTVMLEFCEDPDFLELGLLFATRPLDDHMMTLQRVALPTQVQVHNIQVSDDTEEMLELYFQNPSHGGDESVIVEYVDEKQKHAILGCSSPAVVASVTRRSHTVIDHTVHVAVYYPEFGVIPPNYNASKPWNFNPAPYRHSLHLDPRTASYILLYVIDMKDVCDLLAGVGHKSKLFEIDWDDSSPEGLMLKCHPDYKPKAGSKSWEELCRHELDPLLTSIDVVKIPSSKESLDELLQYASKLADQKSVLIHVEKKVAALTVVGWKSDVAPLQETLNKTSKTLQDVAFRRNNAAEESVRLKSHQPALLRARNFEEIMKQNIPSLEFRFTSSSDLLLKGLPAEIKNAEQLIKQQLHQITSRHVSLRPSRSSLFAYEEIKKAVFSRFDQENIKAVMEVSKSGVTVYAMATDEVQRALNIVNTMLTERVVPLLPENVPVLHSPAWEALQVHVLEKFNGLFEMETDTRNMKITILGLSDICDEVCQMVKHCIEEYPILEHFLPLSAGKVRILEKLCRTDFDKLTSHREPCSVSCEARDQPEKSGYMVKGCKREIQDILPKIEKLISEVLTHDHVIRDTGMPKYFASEKGQDLLKSLEIKHQSVCEVVRMSDASEARVQELYKVDIEGGCTARVIQGDITKLKVDAIVNAANSDLDHIGGLAAAILQAGGDVIQQECRAHVRRNGPVLPGDVFLGRQTGHLPCKIVIHAVGPNYAIHGSNHNKARELYNVVWRSLLAASSMEIQSIALPALSTGIFNYPLKEATEIICDAVLDFFLKHQSTVKEVCLIDLLSPTTKMFRQSLEGVMQRKRVKVTSSSHRPDMSEASGAFPHAGTEYEQTDKKGGNQPGTYAAAASTGIHTEVQTSADGWRKGPKPDILMTPQGLTVQLKKSAIAKEKVDVIVNTTNTNLDLVQGSVSLSILTAAGRTIQNECRQFAPHGINLGSVVRTSAGKTKGVKAIYHGACPVWDSGQGDSSQILKQFLMNCLEKAHMDRFTSIAFPAVGTGKLKFPPHLVSQYMFDVFWEFSRAYQRTSVKDIRVILFDKDIIQAFDAHQNMLLKPSTSSVKPKEQRTLKHSAPRETQENFGKKEDEGLTFKHEAVTIVVKQGDITEETTDAIVNSTTSKYNLKSGKLSSYILKKGGKTIEKEWDEKMKGRDYSTEKHPIITTPGKLRCKCIIHADTQNCWELGKIIDRILQFADIEKVSSLAIPALGLLTKSPKDAAKLMLGAILKFASDQDPQYLEVIHITLFDPGVFTAFKSETEALFWKNESSLFVKLKDYVRNLVSVVKPAEQPVEEVPSEDPVKTEPKLSTTCIRIYSLSQHNIDAVVRRLDDCCEDKTATKFIDSPEEQETINKLDSQTVAQIFDLENTHGVKIEIEKTGPLKKIRVSGAVRDVVRCQKEIRRVLQNLKDEGEELTQQEDQMATRVQWEYRDNEGSHSYDKHNNFRLETAYSNNKPSVSWEENGGQFQVNFDKMIEIQIDRPDAKLSIRRRDLKHAGSTSSASTEPDEESFPPDTETWQRGQYDDVRPKETDPRHQAAPDTDTYQRGQYVDVRPKKTDPRPQAGYNRSQSQTSLRENMSDRRSKPAKK